jgi:hypothetical protein
VKREGLKAWGDRKEGAFVRSTGLTQARQNRLLLMKMSGLLDERNLVAIQVNAPALRRAHRRTAGTEGLESILEVARPSPAVQRAKGGLGGLLQRAGVRSSRGIGTSLPPRDREFTLRGPT